MEAMFTVAVVNLDSALKRENQFDSVLTPKFRGVGVVTCAGMRVYAAADVGCTPASFHLH